MDHFYEEDKICRAGNGSWALTLCLRERIHHGARSDKIK